MSEANFLGGCMGSAYGFAGIAVGATALEVCSAEVLVPCFAGGIGVGCVAGATIANLFALCCCPDGC